MAREIVEMVRIGKADLAADLEVSILLDGHGWIAIDQLDDDAANGLVKARYARNDEEYIAVPYARVAAIKSVPHATFGVL